MKKLILILLFILISANSFASSSSRKYSAETSPVYKGMLGCFDFLMDTRNEKTDKVIIEKRQKANDALENGVKDPVCREMLTCAYEQEIADMEHNKQRLGQREYTECMGVLKSLGKKLGLNQK